jgi:hypothetical protein
MSENNSIPKLNQEDCISLIVEHLGKHDNHETRYGYDLYLPSLMRNWLYKNAARFGIEPRFVDIYLPQVSPYFYNAAWELSRRGILRPGVRIHGEQATEDGSTGNGYSITPFGNQWLSESDKSMFLPTEPGRFSEMIAPYGQIFGPGFQERANEAIRCYGSHAYLACCVMCGAAAESILLHLAIAKTGDEQETLKKYRAANGRKVIEDLILNLQRNTIKQDFDSCFSLLKYWRDESAHGRRSQVAENEAYTSLALLLRCAQFAKDNFQSLECKALDE